jgi:hypothetical protein
MKYLINGTLFLIFIILLIGCGKHNVINVPTTAVTGTVLSADIIVGKYGPQTNVTLQLDHPESTYASYQFYGSHPEFIVGEHVGIDIIEGGKLTDLISFRRSWRDEN